MHSSGFERAHVAAGGHLQADCALYFRGEGTAGQGKDVIVFEVDVAAVQLGQQLERAAQPAEFIGRKRAAQPLVSQVFNKTVLGTGGNVVRFQGVDALHGALNIGVVQLTHTGKEGLLLILSMFGSSLTEVAQGTLKRVALFKVEIAAFGTVSNRNESAQRVLDPAMAVSEQCERILAEAS